MTVNISVTLDGEGNPVTTANPLPIVGTVDIAGTISFPSTIDVAGTVEIGNFPGTQTVAGTVAVNGGTIAIGGTVPVSGSVSIASSDTVTVSGTVVNAGGSVSINGGTVAVANFPTSTIVGGTVSVSNFPTTQAVSGTVGISGGTVAIASGATVAIGNTPSVVVNSGTVVVASGTVGVAGTVPVTGTVNVGNAPTVAVSGTIPVTGTVSILSTDTVAVAGTVAVSGTTTVNVNSGTVSVGNSPTVSVAGTVPVSGSFYQATQPVSGTVSIVSADTVAVTGTVAIGSSDTIAVAGTVNIASGGTIAPVDGLSFTGSATGTGVITYGSPGPSNGIIDTSGYACVSIQATSIGSGNTIALQGSNDGTNWITALGYTPNSSNAFSSSIASTTVPYLIAKEFRYIRINVTAYGSGTISLSIALLCANPLVNLVYQGAGYINSNAWAVYQVPIGSSNLSTARIQSASGTNATSVKTTSGSIYDMDLGNNGTTDVWFKIYNKASAPTVGTDTPIWSVYVPKGTARSYTSDYPIGFSSGLAYAITGGAADSDTTAVAANQLTGVLNYK